MSRSRAHSDINAVARGVLLIAVFYIHAMYGVFQGLGGDPSQAPAAAVQLKLFAPNVSAFFFLSGMAAPYFHRKGWQTALKPSLVLLILAALSHLVTVAIDLAIEPRWYGSYWFARRLFKPVLMGTGYENFVAWFLVVLAFARLFAYLILRSLRWFVLVAGTLALILFAAHAAGAPDNLYEWRNWPTATLFFLIGMRVPAKLRVPLAAGWLALAASLALAWFNRPGLFATGPCLACDVAFVAQPMVGHYGALSVYVLQQLLFGAFLLAIAGWLHRVEPGRFFAFYGRDSLSMLLLHGWVLVALYPAAGRSLPDFESPFLFVSILGAAIVTHGFLFYFLQRWIQQFQKFAFALASLAERTGTAILALSRRGPQSAPRPTPVQDPQ